MREGDLTPQESADTPGPVPFRRPADDPSAAERGRPSSSRLHLRLSEGEPEAVAECCDMIRRVIHHRVYLIPFDERPDVVQETLVDLVRIARDQRFDSDDHFRAFVRTVGFRRAVDWRRRQRLETQDRIAELPQIAGPHDPEQELHLADRRRLGALVVRNLRNTCRELFGLRAGRGLSYQQMAQLLGRSVGALRTQLYDCLKSARGLLQRLEAGPTGRDGNERGSK